jgi:hypothetical protein
VRDELAILPTIIGLSARAHRVVRANLIIAAVVITALITWDIAGVLPLPLGVAGHEGSTVLVGLNGLRLLHRSAWRRLGGAGAADSHPDSHPDNHPDHPGVPGGAANVAR